MMFYNKIMEYLEVNSFLRIINMVIDSNFWEGTSKQKYFEILAYLHEHKWLHYGYEDGKVVAVVGAYRIKSLEQDPNFLPGKEEGNILYVILAISNAKDKTLIKKMLTDYLKEHPEVKKIVFYKRKNDNDFRHISIKGDYDGKEQIAEFTTGTSLPV